MPETELDQILKLGDIVTEDKIKELKGYITKLVNSIGDDISSNLEVGLRSKPFKFED